MDGDQVFGGAIPDSLLTQDLVAWYRFEDGDARDYASSAEFPDVTWGDPTAYDGTVNRATFQSSDGVTDFESGANSGAFSFNNNNNEFIDISSVSSSSNINFQSFPFTAMIWANANSFTDPDGQFIGGEDNGERVWNIAMADISTVSFATFDGNGQKVIVNLDPTQWHHYAMSIDSGGIITGYLDGQQVGTTSTGNLANSSPEIYMGAADFGDSAGYYDGLLDDARIYNKVLTDQEISDIYTFTEP
jgi:hypothetical protein